MHSTEDFFPSPKALSNIEKRHLTEILWGIHTLSIDLLKRGSVNVRHGVQVEIEETIKGHELCRCTVIGGEARREAVLQYAGSELTSGDQTANASNYRGEQRQEPQTKIWKSRGRYFRKIANISWWV